MPESKSVPEIKQLQGGIILPYNIQEVQRENEEGQLETYYVFGKIKLNQKQMPDLSQVKQEIVKALQADLHTCIYPEYDQGSQSTILAIGQKAERQSLTSVVAECEKIMDWIDSCLDHYYAKKDDILVADKSGVCAINWSFSTNCPKPGDLKTLKELREMYSSAAT